MTPEKYWLSAASCGYGSGYEPGSQIEYNPECPKHALAAIRDEYTPPSEPRDPAAVGDDEEETL